MRKGAAIISLGILLGYLSGPALAQIEKVPQVDGKAAAPIHVEEDYTIGVGDILQIMVIQPEEIIHDVQVSPDGFISYPYIGSVKVKGRTLSEIKDIITRKLNEGYFKYPVVYASLLESKSRRFFVYGEVAKPGPFPLEENTTILRAISMAGGLTKYGSARDVKLLTPREGNMGYSLTTANLKSIFEGDPDADLLIKPGDIVVVSGGLL